MIEIDGSIGEGGGQILRTAVALSMVTGQAFRVVNIRASRAKPGLMRQHLTAVNAAAMICAARVEGAAISSKELSFSPGKIASGNYTFSIGSAGSTMLVLQTVLPALLVAGDKSTVVLEGGTHNPHAPPIDFLERAFLPLIARMGAKVDMRLERAGFYPAGGGRVVVEIEPVKKLLPIEIIQRGESTGRLAKAMVAGLPGEIAKRELARVEKMLGWTGEQLQIRQLPSDQGPGNVLTLEVASEQVTEVFTGFGMKGVTAESVAEGPIQQVRKYLASGAPVGECLADQLLLPMAMAGGGAFVTTAPTRHTETNAAVIGMFLPVKISVGEMGRGLWKVSLES